MQRYTLFFILILLNGCIVQFIPDIEEDKELLVVEGIITDQPEPYTIKLSKSLPLGKRNLAKPVKGYTVTVTDDSGNSYSFNEKAPGTYQSDPGIFVGEVGRKYKLRVNSNSAFNPLTYETLPIEMKPVPPIDSLYYEKIVIKEKDGLFPAEEGCQVYLNTHDPDNLCKYFRWEYAETWEFRLPYPVPNRICWLYGNSDRINIKNTSVLGEDRIYRYPLNFVTNQTDRLQQKYSMLVNQYSLNEDEYLYWEK